MMCEECLCSPICLIAWRFGTGSALPSDNTTVHFVNLNLNLHKYHSVYRTAAAIVATDGSNTRTGVSLGRKVPASEVQQRWTAGGDGCSGIARTASVCVTNRGPSLIDTSISGRSRQMLPIISKQFHLCQSSRILLPANNQALSYNV
jgi:hypothetical protein